MKQFAKINNNVIQGGLRQFILPVIGMISMSAAFYMIIKSPNKNPVLVHTSAIGIRSFTRKIP